MTMVLVGSFETTRDVTAQLLKQAPTLRALGLPETGSVLQADAAESPEAKPFLVLRWGDEEERIGDSRVRPFDIWGYDEMGDYNRITKIVREAARYLVEECFHVSAELGSISQFLDRGIGGDLADDGWDAVVKPYRMAAVGRGV